EYIEIEGMDHGTIIGASMPEIFRLLGVHKRTPPPPPSFGPGGGPPPAPPSSSGRAGAPIAACEPFCRLTTSGAPASAKRSVSQLQPMVTRSGRLSSPVLRRPLAHRKARPVLLCRRSSSAWLIGRSLPLGP